MRYWTAAALLALAACSQPTASPEAAHGALASCLSAAARAPQSDPTRFQCAWEELAGIEGLSGLYQSEEPGVTGKLAVLQAGQGGGRVALSTLTDEDLQVCALALPAEPGLPGLRASSPEATGCTVRVLPKTGDESRVEIVVEGDCSFFCGQRGVLEGIYRRGS
jgi:hypothetical protein